ncbi:MAG: helix-turn-helix domain-containing protein [Candidatus Gracilibacteria bacterium]
MEEKLKILGFNDQECKVYFAALKYKNLPVSLIAKEAGVDRVRCYYILNKLIEKGAVTENKKNKIRCYSAVDINILFKKLEHDFFDFKKHLPELQNIQSIQTAQSNVQFFRGMDGVKSLLEDTLSAEKEIVGFVNLEYQLKNSFDFIKYELSEYAKKRIKNKIKFRGLYIRNDASFYIKSKKSNLKALREIRFLPKKLFNINHEMNIYNDKIAYFFMENKSVYGFLIQNPEIAYTQKSVFDFLWDISLKFNQSIPKNFDANAYENKIMKSLDRFF